MYKPGTVAMLVLAVCLGACSQAEPPAQPAPLTPPVPPFRVSASVQEIMESIIDPSADVVWESVGTTITVQGVEEHQPRTDEEWKAVRLRAIELIEGTNLLMMHGRRLVPVNGKIADEGFPGVLTTAEGEQLLVARHDAFVQFASALGEVGTRMVKAIDARQVDQMVEIGTEMDEVCESCHTTFWYPGQQFPAASPAATQ